MTTSSVDRTRLALIAAVSNTSLGEFDISGRGLASALEQRSTYIDVLARAVLSHLKSLCDEGALHSYEYEDAREQDAIDQINDAFSDIVAAMLKIADAEYAGEQEANLASGKR